MRTKGRGTKSFRNEFKSSRNLWKGHAEAKALFHVWKKIKGSSKDGNHSLYSTCHETSKKDKNNEVPDELDYNISLA